MPDLLIGRLCLNGWGGITKTPVEVVGFTPKRTRIKAITRTKLAGRCKWLEIGETTLVPQHSILDDCEICDGGKGGMIGNENIIEGKTMCDYCSRANQ